MYICGTTLCDYNETHDFVMWALPTQDLWFTVHVLYYYIGTSDVDLWFTVHVLYYYIGTSDVDLWFTVHVLYYYSGTSDAR